MATARQFDAPRRTPTTAEELLLWPDDEPGEIIDGVFVPKYVPGEMTGSRYKHGLVAAEIARLLGNYVKANRLGQITAAETAFRLRRSPDLVRCPDAAFIAASRVARGLPDGAFDGAPDLAVEVLSPSNAPTQVQRKVVDFLEHGARAVWVADPDTRTIVVHTPRAIPRWHERDDVLDGGDVLPGFRVATAEVFADLDPDSPDAASRA